MFPFLPGFRPARKTALISILALSLSACGPYDLAEFSNLLAARSAADTGNANIILPSGADYTVKIRALTDDGQIGAWSEDIAISVPLDEAPSTDAETEQEATDSSASTAPPNLTTIEWASQEDANAWEVMIVEADTGMLVTHRAIESDKICGEYGICSLQPGFKYPTRQATRLVSASAYPLSGLAPLQVAFSINAHDLQQLSSVDWIQSGSSEDLPEQTTWSKTFDKPGVYEITLQALNHAADESLSTVTITVEDNNEDSDPADSNETNAKLSSPGLTLYKNGIKITATAPKAETPPESNEGGDPTEPPDTTGNPDEPTDPTPDNEPSGPVISNVTVAQIEQYQATILWDLDQVASGVVEFGEGPEFGLWSTKDESFKWDYHRQTLTGLKSNTTYYFRVHSSDRDGETSISEPDTFTTYEAEPTLGAGNPTDISNSTYNDDLPYGGLFYGNPSAGVHAANSRIAEASSRRFRAERTGSVEAVRYHNRILIQYNIDYRCELWGHSSVSSEGQWCACKDAGLDPISCSYTLGSSYHIGNGGLITIEIRPDDGNGFPSDTVLAKSEPYIPYELEHNSYPSIKLIKPAQLKAGNLYHIVYTNAKPPINCALSHVPISQAKTCERDRGAMGLNGVFYPHSSSTTGSKGPWFGTESAANLYQTKAGGPWTLYESNLSFFELAYSDDVNVGDTYNALSVTIGTAKRTVAGNSRARQRFTVQDASRRVDGVWLNFGHSPTANGSALSVTLKSGQGNVLASGSIAASSTCLATSKGSSWDRHCRDWGYTNFNRTVDLIEGEEYIVEFSAANGADFEVSTIEPLSKYHPFDDRNNWTEARGEFSADAGKSWQDWTSRMPDDRDMSVLFTIEGMPRQMP